MAPSTQSMSASQTICGHYANCKTGCATQAHEATMEDTVGGEYRNKDEFRAAMVRRPTKRQMLPSPVLRVAIACALN